MTVPKKVRITKLQEAQVAAVLEIEGLCAGDHLDDRFPALSENALVALTKTHDVLVATADDEPVGLLVWVDRAPGVAILERCAVHPDFRRLGIASALLRHVAEKAADHGIQVATAVLDERLPAGFTALLAARTQKSAHATLAGNLPAVTGTQKRWFGTASSLGRIPGLPAPG